MEAEGVELANLEKLGALHKRINTLFTPTFSSYVFSQPPNTVVPTAAEVMLMAEWRSALCWAPWEEEPPPDMVADAVEKMPAFIKETMRTRTDYFLRIVRQSKAYAGREVIGEHLLLASTFFRCNKCGVARSKDYSRASFPGILAHSCNFFELDEKGQLGERGSWRFGSLERSDFDGKEPPTPVSAQSDAEQTLLRYFSEMQPVGSKQKKFGQFWRKMADITFDDVAYDHMNLMLGALGLDRTATKAQMEAAQPYVEGLCQCYQPAGGREPIRRGMRWLTAVRFCANDFKVPKRRPVF